MSKDLVKRLRDPAFGTETTERNLMSSAADRIEELEAKLAEVEASIQAWIDAAVEQQVRRKRAEERVVEVTEDRDDALIALASTRKQLERYIVELKGQDDE